MYVLLSGFEFLELIKVCGEGFNDCMVFKSKFENIMTLVLAQKSCYCSKM